MPTVMKHHHTHVMVSPRTTTQKVSIGMGIAFIAMGILGAVMPGMLGMHLSVAHNLLHLVSGALAIWFGYASDTHRAYTLSMVFGSVYGLLSVAGYMIGTPGYPSMGDLTADQHLWRIVPNILEFGSVDHSVHFLISAVFLSTALLWRRSDKHLGTNLYRTNAPLGAVKIHEDEKIKL